MSVRARASTPWVGSSIMSTRVRCSIARASTAFCWLPPDRPATGWSGDAATVPSGPAAAHDERPLAAPLDGGRLPELVDRRQRAVAHHAQLGEDRLSHAIAALEGD